MVLIVDYGMSNLGSIRRSLEECGADVMLSDDPRDLKSASFVVLPGVGAFADGMESLCRMGWVDPLLRAVREDGIPIIGICLGMQLLADRGYEGGETLGLGLIPGEVHRLDPDNPEIRIPHMGWNEVYPTVSHPLFEGIPDGSDFYFVHSYHFVPKLSADILATTPYCGGFVSAVQRENVYGVQFHPEKSGRPGLRFLQNFLHISEGF